MITLPEDANSFEFARVAYDIDVTAGKIKAIPQLHPYLGERLYTGR